MCAHLEAETSTRTTLSQPSFDCKLERRSLRILMHCESWTLKRCDHKGQLRSPPLNSQISFIVPHLIWATLEDCGPTSPTSCALLRKKSLVLSAQPSKISGTMKNVARHLQQKTPHTIQRSSQPLLEPMSRTIERREGKRDAFSDARRGSIRGVNVRKSRCTAVKMTLENSIKRLSI